jgi:hypothetical protein
MNHMQYGLARQRAVELQQAARDAGQARAARAASRHGKSGAEIATPRIPDYAEEMFRGAGTAVPAPRTQEVGGQHARVGC